MRNRNPAAGRGGIKIEFMAEGAPLAVPNKPGLWLFTLTNDKLRVVKRNGALYFEAGTWAEEETPVPAAHRPDKDHSFVQLHPVIDIEATKLLTA